MQRKRTYADQRGAVVKRAKTPTAKVKTAVNRRRAGYAFSAVRFVPSLGPLGFPKRLRATLRFATDLVLSQTAASSTYHAFSANGLFDPDLTGVGIKPYYWDSLMAVYNKYHVLSSTITATCMEYTAGSGTPAINIGVNTNDDTGPGNVNRIQQQADTVAKSMNSQSSPTTLNHRFNSGNYFGPGTTSNPNLEGSATANPTEIAAFILYTSTGTTQTITSNWRIVIDYVAEFTELNDIINST